MIGRFWYYWRTGYSTYLNVPVSASGVLVSVYYLMVERVPMLKAIWPTFSSFALTGVIACAIGGTIVGWLHFAILKAFDAEVRVCVQSNPYFWETTPGKERDLQWPINAELMEYLASVSTDPIVRGRMNALASQCRMLARGGRLSR